MTAVQERVGLRTTWTIDPVHTLAEFGVKHMMFTTVKGRFTGVEGTIEMDEESPENSRVEVTIDAASIYTAEEKRDAHLRSPDFLDVEKYPTLTFMSTSVEMLSDTTFRLNGDLTIHGVTRPVTIDAEWTGRGMNPWGAEVVGFEGSTKIDRKDYGLNWNAALEAGGVLVGEEVKISLAVEATRQ